MILSLSGRPNVVTAHGDEVSSQKDFCRGASSKSLSPTSWWIRGIHGGGIGVCSGFKLCAAQLGPVVTQVGARITVSASLHFLYGTLPWERFPPRDTRKIGTMERTNME